jgi:hypothetical protein
MIAGSHVVELVAKVAVAIIEDAVKDQENEREQENNREAAGFGSHKATGLQHYKNRQQHLDSLLLIYRIL